MRDHISCEVKDFESGWTYCITKNLIMLSSLLSSFTVTYVNIFSLLSLFVEVVNEGK